MAEDERQVEREDTGSDTEHRVPLYPITMEDNRERVNVEESHTEAIVIQETGKNEAEIQPQRLQQIQSLPQLQPTGTQTDRKLELSGGEHTIESNSSQRVHKKSSPNNRITLYLASRDLVVSEAKIDKLQGVLLVDPDYLQDKRVYGQITLTFRYGREDEEVMGLKFCNEAIMCLAQLYPPYSGSDRQETTPLQEALVKRLGPNAHAFAMEITPLAPPSVQLVPAKKYNGAPIGTSYDVRAYVADRADGKLHRETTIQMGIRVIQRSTKPPLPSASVYSVPVPSSPAIGSRGQTCKSRVKFAENEIAEDEENSGPHAAIEKPFLLSDGRVGLEAKLDRAIYAHGDSITVHVNVNNKSNKTVRRIKVFIVQHVDVCMFSNGKFKNVVALLSSQDGCPISPGTSLTKAYTLRPIKGSTKNWIALEDSYTKTGGILASTVTCPGNSSEDRNVFAIYVSYYVKVKLQVSAMGGKVSLKLPFTLMHSNVNSDLVVNVPSPNKESSKMLGKIKDEVYTENHERQDENLHKHKGSKLEPIKEKLKESKDVDVDLIERYEEGDST